MARVVETDEPVVQEREVIRDDAPRSSVGMILAIVLLIIVLIALFAWRPWAGGDTNINVPAPAPTTNTGQ